MNPNANSAGTDTNDENKPLLIKVLIVVSLLLVIGLYWAIDIKWKEVQTNSGFDFAAKRNPYLAAQMFIEQSYPEVERSKSVVESQRGFALIDNLPSTKDSLIITSARYSMSERRTDLLKQWTKDGGNLIVAGKMLYNPDNQSSGDALLDHYDIQVYEADLFQDISDKLTENSKGEVTTKPQEPPKTIGEKIAQASENNAMQCDETPLFSPIPSDNGKPDANVFIDSLNVLYFENTDKLHFWSSDGYGNQIIQLPVGKGMLTAMTDMSLWENGQLACFDNAYLLRALTKNTEKVWLLFDEERPDIMMLLWQKNRTLVISALVLLAFWLWSQTLRFGPIKSITQASRRNFIEHIEAAARYRWRSGEGQKIITLLQHQILQKVAQRYPDLTKMSEQQQITLIARLSDMPATDIQQALYSVVAVKNDQIVSQVQRLQQLRKHLC